MSELHVERHATATRSALPGSPQPGPAKHGQQVRAVFLNADRGAEVLNQTEAPGAAASRYRCDADHSDIQRLLPLSRSSISVTDAKLFHLSQGERIMVNIKGSSVVVTGGSVASARPSWRSYCGGAPQRCTPRRGRRAKRGSAGGKRRAGRDQADRSRRWRFGSETDIVTDNAGVLGASSPSRE